MASPEKNPLAILTQIYGESINRKFILRSQVLIGRSFKSQIKLSNPNVSRRHCNLTHTDKGWEIVDNNSQNGTYICGKRLKPGEPCLLQCGDIIFLGPPSEMPEAFCFDDAFVEANIVDAIDIESEKHSVKRSSDPEVLSPSKKRNSADGHLNELINQDSGVDVQHSSSALQAGASVKSLSSNSATAAVDKRMKKTTKHKCSVLSKAIPCTDSSPELKVKEEKEQIHEISSTADDQAESSPSLLICSETEGAKNKLSGTSSMEVLSMSPDCHTPKKSSETFSPSSLEVSSVSPDCHTSNNLSEAEALKLKLAKLSAEVKKLQQSESNLLNQKKTLVEQLEEQNKLKDALKDCESKAKDEVKNELLEKFEEDLICNICTELLIKPTVLDCSHTFCLYCIKEWKKKKNECPVCRNKIQTMTPVLTLEHFIDKTLSTLTPEQRDKRNQIVKEREELEKKKVATPKRKKPRASPYRNRRYQSRRPMAQMFQQSGSHYLPTTLHEINNRRAHVFQRPGTLNLPSTSDERSEVEVIAERRNRHLTTSSANEVQVISNRRNIVIPYQLNSLIQHMNFRVPEVLLSDSEVDSGISIYITS